MKTEIKKIKEQLGETTNYDINLIEVDTTQKIYDKYELPALFIEGNGEFRQGDATDEEIFEAARNINDIVGDAEINVFYNEGHEWEEKEGELNAEELYSFLEKKYWEVYKEELMKAVKANWQDFYKEDIRLFLKENYATTGRQFGYDYSIFINIETGEIWEEVHASSNWMFQYEDENRKLIFHANNYDKPFKGFIDYVSEYFSKENIDWQFNCDIPEEIEDDFDQIIEWLKENASDAIKDFDLIAREEAIDNIIDLIEEEN